MYALSSLCLKYLKLAYRIAHILLCSVVDVYTLLYMTFGKLKDLEGLQMQMRFFAHILERTLQNPKQERKHSVHATNIYERLGKLIQKWEREDGDFSRDIKWVKKVYNEFARNLETGWYCELLGKPLARPQGVREIEEHNSTNSQTAKIDLLEFFKGRRSIRAWKNEPVSREQLKIVIEAGTWAPSSCNRQACKFIVIDNRQTINTVARTAKGGRSFFYNAPALIVVICDIRCYQFPDEKHTPYQDAAAAIQNMLLMAHRMALGACWGSYCSHSIQIIGERKVRRLLNIPGYFKIAGLVALGKPNAQVCTVPRKDLSKCVIWRS